MRCTCNLERASEGAPIRPTSDAAPRAGYRGNFFFSWRRNTTQAVTEGQHKTMKNASNHYIQRADPEINGFNAPVVNSGLTNTADMFKPLEKRADVRDVLVKCDRNEIILKLDDFNGWVGVQREGYEKLLDNAILIKEIMKAIKRMKVGKATGYDRVLSGMLWDDGVQWQASFLMNAAKAVGYLMTGVRQTLYRSIKERLITGISKVEVDEGNKANEASLTITNSQNVSRQARLAIHNGVLRLYTNGKTSRKRTAPLEGRRPPTRSVQDEATSVKFIIQGKCARNSSQAGGRRGGGRVRYAISYIASDLIHCPPPVTPNGR
ncbi:hypothetical protein EVAR_37699_1 [Eumeta japonica]|uniref:Uncharacterized protein n=1 Tax=Eumeta variegata TaxID=151549 RepID=A0A4C1XQB6_EUMVA|nr:hypothetical protein EVAR_37699_1 [Eumeta japonica]